MAYPTVVMEMTAGREIRAIDSWSTPQVSAALSSALYDGGPALSIGATSPRNIDADTALLITTSGSTGAAKTITHTANSLLFNARATLKFLDAAPNSVWSLLLPLTHIAGINVLIRALESKTEVVTIDQSADYTAIVPTQLHRALTDTKLLAHLQGCKAVLVGGGPLDSQLRSEAHSRGINVITTYGMTETCGGVVYDGKPLDGISLKIVDDRIAIKGEQVSRDVVDGDGWFLTSDRGEIRDGLLSVLGRIDDQIISGGEKISLSAVEEFLRSEYANREIATFAKPDPQWGERLCIATTIALPGVAARLKNHFGDHVSPKEVITVSAIPYLSIGKVDRKKLANDLA